VRENQIELACLLTAVLIHEQKTFSEEETDVGKTKPAWQTVGGDEILAE
jgi:hypothetical protein